ncbi:MAG: type II toxin-antitoxin system RelE/ParE family toxin [Hydrogenophaga sp.]|nr:type II toxin-antitoxin system RelE/ParE family toxin [Hydrogenophaga sp.]
MSLTKPVRLRALAVADVDDAIRHYLQEAGPDVALGFIDELEQAYTHLGRQPGTGSPRYAPELNLPGLRSWPLSRYPYIVFYAEQSDHVDVWRVLHSARDMPAWLSEGDPALP